ncbi:hypothetical protein CDV31_001110 [Fusarium ambrosium]|uniref:Uncharacterized protein n=1 Tax=Fusarium ambrosium TaxID=131363 RepID=A0A428V0H7_9HYPO|nr:hypothetical protein CDV31_001110 [Fusarium ambrosium]
MPGPPTPVSCCPLKRLEIRDGGTVKAFNSCPPHNIFNLTIEGERPIDSETGTLILLIHQGFQQVVCKPVLLPIETDQQVSIRLGDLARNPQAQNDIVSIDKHLNQLCITIPGKGQAVIAQFEEKRDFSVAVCLLQKSDLHVSDYIPSSPSTTYTTYDSSNHIPRPSSIPPMAFVSPAAQTFGADVPLIADTQIHPSLQPMSYHIYPQRTASVPIYSSPYFSRPVSPDMTHLNPHNMFLGRNNTNMHIPRVGSPLKHSFNPGSQQSSSSKAESVSDWFSPTNSQSSMSVEGLHATANPITNREKTPVNRSHSPNVDSQGSQSESSDFRDLMPQPRKLPFQSHSKRSISQTDTKVPGKEQESSPRAKRTRGLPSKTASNEEVRRYEAKGSQTINPGVDSAIKSITAVLNRLTPQAMPEQIPTTRSRDAECQTEIPTDPNANQQVDQLQSPVPSQTVLVVDSDMLRELDEATASLFEQYETDIATSNNSQLCAAFYMDRIYSKRRDFWLAKLEELAAGQWQQLSS